MTITDPMFDLGGRSAPAPGTSPDPRRLVGPEELEQPFAADGVNGAFLADFLSAALTHERCGTHLYRSVAARTLNPMLKARYRELGRETQHHVDVLSRAIAAIGGDPSYVSRLARGVERADTGTLESTYALSGSLDPMEQEAVMLDAVLVAETVDHANWSVLAKIVNALPEGPVRSALADAVAEVEPQEDEHLAWARDTKARMTMMQVTSPTMAGAMGGMEAIAAKVRDMFSDLPGT
jgi:rubrerythrin